VLDAGLISRANEDVDTKASALGILLLISADHLTAQSVSMCLDAASLKDSDIGSLDLLQCQFRKLVDKLSEHSSNAQNIEPTIATQTSTASLVPAHVIPCKSEEKLAKQGADHSSDIGLHTIAIVSQPVIQDKQLQYLDPSCGHEGQPAKRATPCLPALPPSMMFSAPLQTPQVCTAHLWVQLTGRLL
jgi:hypothetical protein